MTNRASRCRWLPSGATAIGLLLAGGGCGSDEPAAPSPQAAAAVTSAPAETTREAAPEVSPEAQAAETAFRVMTTQNASPDEWVAANQRLQDIGPPALPVLVQGLTSDNQVKREMASSVLAWFGIEAEPAAEQLIKALEDDSTFVRANAATALLQMPDHVDRVVPVLAEFFESEDADLRRMAATNLAAIETEQALPLLPQLIAALDDGDRDVVYYSTQLLGRVGPEAADALPKLKAIKADGDDELQSAVTTAILLIDPEGAAE